MRVLCDTNILARAATRPGGPAQELVQRLLGSADHELIVTPFVLDELTRVLGYLRVRLRSTVTIDEIASFLDRLERVAYLADRDIPSIPAVAQDPQDDPIIAGAIAGRADFLCTRDRHLYAPAVLAFLAEHGIRVADELSLLAELRQSESS